MYSYDYHSSALVNVIYYIITNDVPPGLYVRPQQWYMYDISKQTNPNIYKRR